MEGGEALFDSRVIVEYLDTLSPVGKLIPAVGRERAEVKTWEALADGVLDALILARLEANWAGRPKAQRSQAWIDRQLGKVAGQPQGHEPGPGRQAVLRRHPPEPGRHRRRLRAGLPGFPLSRRSTGAATHPNLAKLHDKLMQRPSFADTRAGLSRPRPALQRDAKARRRAPLSGAAGAGAGKKNAAKRPGTKEGGREEEKSRLGIATGPDRRPEGFAA